LIRRQGIRYVFWGPEEQALGDWLPLSADFLRPLAQFGSYALFEVAVSP
jgi:hypothetical protein